VKEEHRLMILENHVLRKVCELATHEITKKWRKFYDEELL
jgi:hypothetical protein